VEAAPVPSTSRAEKFLPLAGIGVFLTVMYLWIASVCSAPDSLLGHDWVMFYRVGEAVRAGQWDTIYAPSTDFPFVYPPYAIYLFAPLGWLTPTWAYVVCVAIAYLEFVLSIWILSRLMPARRQQLFLVTSLALASAPWLGLTITGHLSVLYLLSILAGWLAWRNQKPLLAGLAFSVLLVKPNLGIPFALLFLAKRQGRLLGAMLMGAGVLVAVTAPLGLNAWQAWWDASRNFAHLYDIGTCSMTKQLTLFSLWQLLLVYRVPALVVKLTWALTVAPLFLGLVLVWRGPLTAAKLTRLSGVSVLFLVAANPYLYFYDGLLLVIPAALWYLRGNEYSSRQRHRLCGVFLTLIYLWGYCLFIPGVPLPLSLIGLLSAAWCGVEIWDLCASTGLPGGQPFPAGHCLFGMRAYPKTGTGSR